jgi:hypothetical protein
MQFYIELYRPENKQFARGYLISSAFITPPKSPAASYNALVVKAKTYKTYSGQSSPCLFAHISVFMPIGFITKAANFLFNEASLSLYFPGLMLVPTRLNTSVSNAS